MTPDKSFEPSNGAAASTHAADQALGALASAVREGPHDAVQALERATARAGEMTQHGLEAIRDTSRDLRAKALDASDRTMAYIKDEPVKAMLIAAATGAALMALITLVSRHRV